MGHREPERRRADPVRRGAAPDRRREARAERAHELQGQWHPGRRADDRAQGGGPDDQRRAARQPRREHRQGGDRSHRAVLREGGDQVTEQALTRATIPAGTRRRRPSLLPWILPAVIVALWWGSVSLGVFETYQVPPPPVVLDAAIAMWRRGLLQQDLLATIARVLEGFPLGSLVAIALGTLTGLSARAERALEPTLQALRSVPTLGWWSMLLLWFGMDDPPRVILVAIGAFFPVYVNLVAGVSGVDRKLVDVARVFDLSEFEIARRVVLPAALPELLTGLRLGATQSWLFVVVAEFFGTSSGLGFRLTDSQQSTRVDLMFVAIVALAVLGKLTDTLIRVVERRVLRWRDTLGEARR